MTENIFPLFNYIHKTLEAKEIIEAQILSYIEKSDDGVTLLEELEEKYFHNESYKKYFSVLRSLHKTTITNPTKELLIIQDSFRLSIPTESKDILLKKIKDLYLAYKFLSFLEASNKYVQHQQYSKTAQTIKEFIDASFKLLEFDDETQVSSFGDLTFQEIYDQKYIDKFSYSSLEGLLIAPGSLNVIGGRPGHGKTTFALNLMLKCNNPCVFFSYEMSVAHIQDKLVRAKLNIDKEDINNKQLQICEALLSFHEEQRIFILDSSKLTLEKLIAKIRFLNRQNKIRIFFIDYLGLIPSHKRFEKRYLEIASLVRSLKLLSVELQICIFLLAQLSRNADSKETPTMSDLKESGAIEESADLIMLIYSYSSQDITTDKLYDFAVRIVKNRHGAVGNKLLYFNKKSGLITDNFQEI